MKAYYSLYPNQRPIFFFDEIHRLPNWERFVRSWLNRRYEVYLTGSNAELLKYATALGGRYIEKEVLPLSFKEFLRFKNIHFYSPEAEGAIQEFLDYGGFPALVLNSNKEELLKASYNSTIFRDVVSHYGVKEELILELLIKKLAENLGKVFSFNSITRKLKALGINTNTHSYPILWLFGKSLFCYHCYSAPRFLSSKRNA